MTSRKKGKGRLIVIDGPNVGMAHSMGNWPASSRGILLAVEFYKNLGYSVMCFVPRHFLIAGSKRGADDTDLLNSLRKRGNIATVPSQDHDDLYWLSYAWDKEALVVTNDRLKDHAEKFDGGIEKFHGWRKKMVISYTFAGDDFIQNPAFDLPPPDSDDATQSDGDASTAQAEKGDAEQAGKTTPKKGGGRQSKREGKKGRQKGKTKSLSRDEKPTVRSGRRAFRQVVRDLLAGGAMNCGLLAAQITAEVASKLGYDFKDRRELMEVVNIDTKMPFHLQLEALMKDEISVELVGGNPRDVCLAGDVAKTPKSTGKKSAHKGKEKPTKLGDGSPQTESKKRAWGERISLPHFKKFLSSNNLKKIAVPASILPEEVERSIEFFQKLEFPVNSATVGNQFKNEFGYKMNDIFKNLDNLVTFLNFRREFEWTSLEKDKTMIILRKEGAKPTPVQVEKIGFFTRFIRAIKNSFS